MANEKPKYKSIEEMFATKKKHSIFLIVYVIFLFVVYLYSSYVFFYKADLVLAKLPNASISSINFLGVLYFFNIVCLFGVLNWKKWGIALFFFSSLTSAIILGVDGLAAGDAFTAFSPALLLGMMTNKKFDHFT